MATSRLWSQPHPRLGENMKHVVAFCMIAAALLGAFVSSLRPAVLEEAVERRIRLARRTGIRISRFIRRARPANVLDEESDPVLAMLAAAPYDDEPLTEDDKRHIAEGRRAYQDGQTVSAEDAKQACLATEKRDHQPVPV